MAETYRTSIDVTRRWHALAEKRRAYFVELYRSGRWRRYYTEDAFLAHLKEVMQGVEVWQKVLERWPAETPVQTVPAHRRFDTAA